LKNENTVACIYKEDEEWYFGRIDDLYDIREEIKIEFLHPKGSDGHLTGYKFPRRINSTWVECNPVIQFIPREFPKNSNSYFQVPGIPRATLEFLGKS
jgi:hypothetical protein